MTTFFRDHKPLQGLENFDKSAVPNQRVVRLVERLLPYCLEFKNVRGADNQIADFQCRNPLPLQISPEAKRLEQPCFTHRLRLARYGGKQQR